MDSSSVIANLQSGNQRLLPNNNVFFDNLSQDVGPGFGNQQHKYAWSMQEFGNHLYIGTNTVGYDLTSAVLDSGFRGCLRNITGGILGLFDCLDPFIRQDGGQIWRLSYDTGSWEVALDSNEEAFYSGFRRMEVYNGRIYATAATRVEEEASFFLISSTDGTNWEKEDDGPQGGLASRAMTVYQNMLYVGLDGFPSVSGVPEAAELWNYDGTTWTYLSDAPFGNSGGVGELLVHDDKLWIGITNDVSRDTSFGLYTYDGTSFDDTVAPDLTTYTAWDGIQYDLGAIGSNNLGVSTMISYNGQLWVGTANFIDGFSLFVTDGSGGDWELVTADGFGDDRNTYAWQMLEFEGRFLIGTFNSGFLRLLISQEIELRSMFDFRGTGELWSLSLDEAKKFESIRLPAGWGCADWGIRTMKSCFNGARMCIGSASNFFWPQVPQLLARWLGAGTEIWSVEEIPDDFNVFESWP